MALEIKQYSADMVAQKCAKRLVELLPSSSPSLFLISGGSCLALLPHIVKEIIVQKKDVSSLTVGFVDERFDPVNSNYVTMTREQLPVVNSLKNLGVTFIDTSPHKSDQYEMADWYETRINKVLSTIEHEHGKILCLLGMGPDGHIAGILPFPENKAVFDSLFLGEKNVVGFDATGKNQFTKRFTITYPLLQRANSIVGYIVGEQKRDPLKKVSSGNFGLNELPGEFLKTTEKKIEIFTDIVL